MSGERVLKGKNVIVTGGASGISKSICEHFLRDGINRLAIIDINSEQGNLIAKQFNATYGVNKVTFVKCDITNYSEVDSAIDEIVESFKIIDILVNGAGVINEKSWDSCVNINLSSLIYLSYKIWNLTRADKGGLGATIINIASIYGLRADKFVPVYHATKHGVIGFSKSLGCKYHHDLTMVRVLTLCPGFTDTSLLAINSISLDSPKLEKLFVDYVQNNVVLQSAEHIGENIGYIFANGDSGSVWVVEDNKAPYQV